MPFFPIAPPWCDWSLSLADTFSSPPPPLKLIIYGVIYILRHFRPGGSGIQLRRPQSSNCMVSPSEPPNPRLHGKAESGNSSGPSFFLFPPTPFAHLGEKACKVRRSGLPLPFVPSLPTKVVCVVLDCCPFFSRWKNIIQTRPFLLFQIHLHSSTRVFYERRLAGI